MSSESQLPGPGDPPAPRPVRTVADVKSAMDRIGPPESSVLASSDEEEK